MANTIPTKAVVGIASNKPTKFDLSCKHITTTDFGLLRPIYSRMLVPGDKFNVKVSSFTRLDAMPSPSMAEIKVHTRGFFVPFRTVLKGFNEFIANTLYINSKGIKINPVIPYFTEASICFLFANYTRFGTKVSEGYDLIIPSPSDGTTVKIRLTPVGRQVYNVLLSLGYNFNYNQFTSERQENVRYSALPLLAFVKAYIDWFVPSRYYYDTYQISNLLKFVNYDYSVIQTSDSDIWNNEIRVSGLEKLLADFSVFFTEDYFSNCFSEPFGNNNPNVNPVIPQPDLHVDGDDYSLSPVSGNAEGGAYGEVNANYFGSFQIKSMGAIQRMLDRNAIVDQKLLDYIKTEYGLTPNEDSLNLSHYLGSSSDTIKIGDVMSNSDTFDSSSNSGAMLGQYAGRGLGYQNGEFNFESKEFGMLFIMQDLAPTPLYYQGVHHDVMALDRFDFFTPEFDSLGTEAVPLNRLIAETPSPDAVFGFMPYYSDYKVGHDKITGNFRMKSINAGLDSWYLARDISPYSESGMTISANFQDASILKACNPFDSIFYTDSENADHFYQIHDINVTAYRRMKSLVEQVLDDEDAKKNGVTEITRQGTSADRQ